MFAFWFPEILLKNFGNKLRSDRRQKVLFKNKSTSLDGSILQPVSTIGNRATACNLLQFNWNVRYSID